MRRNWGKVAAFAALAAVFVAVPGVGDVAEAQAGWQSGDGLIGNRIWADTDGDGIQDPNESGQEGVVVDLYSDTNQHLARGASGPGGWWGYPNLTTGRCYVVFVQLQGGQANSPRQAGTDMTKDSDFGTDSRTRVCLTADSPVRTDVDAGFTVPNLPFWARGNAGLGNRVWNDLDRDGIQDPGEPGLEGIPLVIDALGDGDGDNNIAGHSGPGGWYGLTGLTPGCYKVKVELTNWRVTPELRGTDTHRDSDLIRDLRSGFSGHGASDPICLGDGQVNTGVDIGLHALELLPDPGLDQFVPLGDVTSIAAGYFTTCASLANGRVRCWGANNAGQAGHEPNEFTEVSHAVEVDGVDASSVSAGAIGHCALRLSGDGGCWGINDGWGLHWVPPASLGTDGAVGIDGGTYSGCSVRSDGTARCWGFSWLGQLGDGLPATGGEGSWKYPVPVGGLVDAVEVSRFSDHGCARRVDGTVVCWGSNSSGQLGSDGDRTGTARPVMDLTGVTDIATTNETSCAVKSDGTVWCWGAWEGGVAPTPQLRETNAQPRQVAGLDRIVAIEIAPTSACAVRDDGSVWCWGASVADGERGNGTTTAGPPTKVTLAQSATAITVGMNHACAITAEKTVVCWGDNLHGQLGDGTGQDRLTPVTVLRKP